MASIVGDAERDNFLEISNQFQFFGIKIFLFSKPKFWLTLFAVVVLLADGRLWKESGPENAGAARWTKGPDVKNCCWRP